MRFPQTNLFRDKIWKIEYSRTWKKNQAIIDTVVEKQKGQPVLLITRTAEAAEYFSTNLFQLDIPNNLLIAQNVSKKLK